MPPSPRDRPLQAPAGLQRAGIRRRALVYNTYYIKYINKSTRKLRVNYGVNDAGPFLT